MVSPEFPYCLMPNHVHLIAVPKTEDGLRLAAIRIQGTPYIIIDDDFRNR